MFGVSPRVLAQLGKAVVGISGESHNFKPGVWGKAYWMKMSCMG